MAFGSRAVRHGELSGIFPLVRNSRKILNCQVPLLVGSSYIEFSMHFGKIVGDAKALEAAGRVRKLCFTFYLVNWLHNQSLQTVTESVGNIRTVQALTSEHHFHNQYLTQLSGPYAFVFFGHQLSSSKYSNLLYSYSKSMRVLHIYGGAFGFAQCVPFFLYAVGFAYGGYLIQVGIMQPLDVFRLL